MLTKTVLCAARGGAVKLVEVPFSWHHGEPLPADAMAQFFPTAGEALSELAARGRQQNRVHVPKPQRTPVKTDVVGSQALEGREPDTPLAGLS